MLRIITLTIAVVIFVLGAGISSYVLLNPTSYPMVVSGVVSLVLLVAMLVVAPACKSFFDSHGDADRPRRRR
jgi:hypothetical protein